MNLVLFLRDTAIYRAYCYHRAKLRVYNVFLRRSCNKIVINFDGNDKTIGPQVFRFLVDR